MLESRVGSREPVNLGLKIIASVLLFALLGAPVASAATNLSLDKKGRFGCIACHGDKRLVKEVKGEEVSLYVDENAYAKSVHGKLSCLSCHTDFSFRDHSRGVNNFKKTAGLACIRCHDHEKQYKTYIKSIHGRLAMGDEKKKGATCGDCHSYKIHEISKSKEFKNDFFFAAEKTCGKDGCHNKYYESYYDWYHGQAYKKGAVDSPACWNCHGAHDVYAKNEAFSKTSDDNLGATCGICHPGSENSFGVSYKETIHNKRKNNSENIVIKYTALIFGVGQSTVDKTTGMYDRATQWIVNIYEFFFPQSLRPIKEKNDSKG